jgi:hypothetical protein
MKKALLFLILLFIVNNTSAENDEIKSSENIQIDVLIPKTPVLATFEEINLDDFDQFLKNIINEYSDFYPSEKFIDNVMNELQLH